MLISLAYLSYNAFESELEEIQLIQSLKSFSATSKLLAFSFAVVGCADDSASDVTPDVAKPTIVFSDLNWTSAQVQNRIAQFIVENGYEYETDAILGGTLPNFQGLLKGDIHVDMEVWLPNQKETFQEK